MTTIAGKQTTGAWISQFVEAAVVFLVGCLDCGWRGMEDRCGQVLSDFGPEIIPQLRRISRRADLSYGHYWAVMRVIDAASATDRRSPGVATRLFETMCYMIKRNRMDLVRPGLELAKYLPAHTLSEFLVTEALNHRSEVPYFDRLLTAAELTKESPTELKLDELLRIVESNERRTSKGCKRLLEKVRCGELRVPSCQGGTSPHLATDSSTYSAFQIQLRGCSIRRSKKGSITCHVWTYERTIEFNRPVNIEH